MSKFIFWYKLSELSATQYVCVYAFSLKQAWRFFLEEYSDLVQDFDYIESKPAKGWHNVGSIEGINY